eukprot:TRINITY_DN460_c0_g1_i7.p2 TRINITY_DN460_c0_g1~~TRINITY_DN460_c0_g1_i7.p2  ORF type:complete len:111 (-),score=1.39 TRINITY_DN460_c0_g1_i7:188-520(-)
MQVGGEIPGLNPGTASKTTQLEDARGQWNSECRGEIRRYWEEHRWRRRPSGPILTLRRESVGSKQDQIPWQSTPQTMCASRWGSYCLCGAANALSTPPGEYGRKVKTQRN